MSTMSGPALEPLYKFFCVIITIFIIVFLSLPPLRSRIRYMKEKYYRHCIDLYISHGKKEKLYQYIQRIVQKKQYTKLHLFPQENFPYPDDKIFSVTKFIIFSILGTELSDAQIRKALISSNELYYALSDWQIDIIIKRIFTEDDKEERYALERLRRF